MNYMDYSDFSDMEQLMQNEEFMMILLWVAIGMLAALFVGWLFTLFPRYYMIKASGVGPAWSAFIPLWQDVQMFKIAGWKGWYFWIYFAISIAGSFAPDWLSIIITLATTIFSVVLYWKACANFGVGTFGKILSIFFTWFVLWYVALTKKPYTNPNQMGYYQQQNNQDWYQQ